MNVKLLLPALTEAKSPLFRPIKYSLFPPLGLATLAAYLPDNADVDLQDEHVEPLDLDDTPDLVIIQVYITNASRAYRYADHYRKRGAHVCLGGLHVTSLPDEAAAHADTIFLGPGEDTFPEFLADFKNRRPKPRYHAPLHRHLHQLPPIRRDLIKRHLYLVPNSISVTRGCPHHCDFCYKDAFFGKGTGFYVRKVDEALAEIQTFPGKHVYFLDDHLFGNPRFAAALFDGMKGMNRVFQGAATVNSLVKPGLLEQAAAAGMRAVFVGFENLNPDNLRHHGKTHNLGRNYHTAIRRARENGLMVNGSFVFGMDGDTPDVFTRTTDWAVDRGIETATFHVMTPYPGTGLYQRMQQSRRLLHDEWDLYDTRHAVFQPARMPPHQLETGYQDAYRRFYSITNILAATRGKSTPDTIRHLAYAIAWKKCEWLWQPLIRMKQVTRGLPLLERALDLKSTPPRESTPPAPNRDTRRQCSRAAV
ncbi:MAG: B12-binding domain-containing radical SAM protein [Verrucomicrobiota bacterium JB025]|nr:radical SAM protein [Verrucomicrobiota bacterium JB025]